MSRNIKQLSCGKKATALLNDLKSCFAGCIMVHPTEHCVEVNITVSLLMAFCFTVGAISFDDIPVTETLNHLTANRAKAPQKRPPSKVLILFVVLRI